MDTELKQTETSGKEEVIAESFYVNTTFSKNNMPYASIDSEEDQKHDIMN